MSTKEGEGGRMGGRGEGREEDNYTKLRRKGETEGKEKRYMDTTLYSIHPANIYTGLPCALCQAVENVE